MKRIVEVFFLVAGFVLLASPILKAGPEMATKETMQPAAPAAVGTEAVPPETAPAEDENYSYGIVQGIDQKSNGSAVVTIAEYDYEGDQNINTNYIVNTNTKFDNIKSVAELAKNDSVEIYFKANGDDKIATHLIKEVIENDETPTEDEMPSGEPAAPAPRAEPAPAK